jgi:hypothetical protein
MTLAPTRGAPPGAPIPDFPIEEARVKPAQPTAASATDDQPPKSPIRPRQTPIEIGGSGIILTFRVIPEQPAIARASMTVHIVADAVGPSPRKRSASFGCQPRTRGRSLPTYGMGVLRLSPRATRTVRCSSNTKSRTPGRSCLSASRPSDTLCTAGSSIGDYQRAGQ